MSRFDHDGPLTDVERDELAAFSLGSLTDSERLAVEMHVEDCSECRSYLRWLDPAVDLLPAAVGQEEPPAALRRELMATVRSEVKAARRAEREAGRTGSRGLWGLALQPATAIAVGAVVAVGAIGGYALRGDDPAPRATVTEARPTVEGTGGAFAATLERVGDKGILHVEKMPPLPGDRVYQLWIDRDGELEPSTPFVIRRDGANEVAVDGSLAGSDTVFVTREPRGGSERPTTPVVMKAPTA